MTTLLRTTTILALTILASMSVYAEEASTATTEQVAPPARSTIPSLYMERSELLAQSFSDNERLLLEVTYDESGELQNFLGLQQPARTPERQGAVLFIHDKEQHADWPGALRQLRTKLPDDGWYTLSINLPLDNTPELPERTLPGKTSETITLSSEKLTQLPALSGQRSPQQNPATSEPKVAEEDAASEADAADSAAGEASQENVDINLEEKKADTATPKIPYEERAFKHLESAMQYLNQSGYRNNVIISFGESSSLVLAFLQQIAPKIGSRGFAIILIGAEHGKTQQSRIPEMLGKNYQGPILDIIDGSRTPDSTSQHRKKMFEMATASNYRQITIPNLDAGITNKSLESRIKAWLKANAQGMSARQAL